MAQKVIRSYNQLKWSSKGFKELQELLDQGYNVKFLTPVNDDYIEYVLEKT